MVPGYCFKCRAHVDFEPNKEIKLEHRRIILTGRCSVCNGKIAKIIGLSDSAHVDRGLPVRIGSDEYLVIQALSEAWGVSRREAVRRIIELFLDAYPEAERAAVSARLFRASKRNLLEAIEALIRGLRS